MEEAGAKLLNHYRKLAFMGFVAVVKNLGEISKNLDLCKKQILEFNPDVVIFIDYPGFNLRIAEFAKTSGFRTFYYISPKLWAWNEGRVKKIREYIDRMFIIFPFFCPIMYRTECLMQRKGPLRFVSSTRSQSCSVISRIGFFMRMPALLTRISTVPNS